MTLTRNIALLIAAGIFLAMLLALPVTHLNGEHADSVFDCPTCIICSSLGGACLISLLLMALITPPAKPGVLHLRDSVPPALFCGFSFANKAPPSA